MAKKSKKKINASPSAADAYVTSTGMCVRSTGSQYDVLLDDSAGEVIPCKVKGNFRLKGIRTTNPVAVGDRVTLLRNADGSAYITAVAPRNYIIRRASNLSKEASILAANLDGCMLVATLKHPVTATTFIDRFLATAEAYSVPATLVINKTDLLDTDDDRELLEAVRYLYESIGYNVVPVSAHTGEWLAPPARIAARPHHPAVGQLGRGEIHTYQRPYSWFLTCAPPPSATFTTRAHTHHSPFADDSPLPFGRLDHRHTGRTRFRHYRDDPAGGIALFPRDFPCIGPAGSAIAATLMNPDAPYSKRWKKIA